MDPALVRAGRVNEMDFMAELGKRVGCKDGIWDVKPVSVCMERTGKPPIGVRWVEHDKNAGSDPPDVRCRLVVQETKRVTTLDTASDPGAAFASTVPLEALRLMFSMHQSRPKPNLLKDNRDDDYVLMLLDISKAHPHAEQKRELYTKLPAEHPCGGDPKLCGLLRMNLYGAKDAGKNFEDLIARLSKEAKAKRGSLNSCIYYQKGRDLSYLVSTLW